MTRNYKRIIQIKAKDISDLLSHSGVLGILIRPGRAGVVGEYVIEAPISDRLVVDHLVELFNAD